MARGGSGLRQTKAGSKSTHCMSRVLATKRIQERCRQDLVVQKKGTFVPQSREKVVHRTVYVSFCMGSKGRTQV